MNTTRLLAMVMMIHTASALAGDLPEAWRTLGGKKSDVQWQARWIWIDGPASPRNLYVCARKDFDISWTAGDLRLHISADSRYRLYLNGQWLGDGPARSFYWAQQFDTYDVTGMLQPGKNTVAVLVSHYGEGTFQYNPSGQGGLLVQLEQRTDTAWKTICQTDETWQMRAHASFARPTMRIACQMPFEEIFDARPVPANWMDPHGGLPHPQTTKIVGPVGEGPWRTLVARSVPFLTRDPVPPVRLYRTALTRMPNFHTGFTARPYLLGDYKMQKYQILPGFAATVIDNPADQTVTFFVGNNRFEMPVINGQQTESGKPFRLRKGPNLCVIPFRPSINHAFDRSYAAFTEQPILLRGVFNNETAWTIFGPFDNCKEVYAQVGKAKSVDELADFRNKAQVVDDQDILANGSPFDESTFARTVPGTVRIDNLDGLFGSPDDVTVVYPSDEGQPEIFLDFGQELVGWTELDIEAPAGTVLTVNLVEDIEEGRRIHYTIGNHNAFRYIAGGGRERYTTFLRRGYRYAKLILSDMTGPVRIRSIRTLFATHPANERGSFVCSDPMLNRIWEIGRHTLRCCSEDTFTDCPTYEQTYWVGDARNEAMIDYAAYGNLALTRRCAELPILSLFRQPITESQVPSAWDNLLTGWWLLWIQMAEEHYQFSGNRDYLAGVYPGVKRSLLNAREQLLDERGLLAIDAWNLFDWAGQDIGHKLVTHNQMWLAEAYKRAAFMARTLGQDQEADQWETWRTELIAAINRNLWDDAQGAYIDAIHENGQPSKVISQQTNALAIAYDVAPPERAERIKDVLVSPPEGMVQVGSPFALFYILEALVHQDRHAEVLSIIRTRWGEMVVKGATTFWETFPGRDKDWWTRSYCHAWSAAPTYFLSRYQLGIWWAEPGYRVARIAPVPLDLSWARGSVPTPHGDIAVAWSKADKGFTLDVTLPTGVAGIVELPGKADRYAEIQAGDYKPERDKDRWIIRLPAGIQAHIEAR